ncbi:MAG: hypothetical protein ACYCVH_10690 [Ignavibacteriaceae bacterium]
MMQTLGRLAILDLTDSFAFSKTMKGLEVGTENFEAESRVILFPDG